jgi:hypothetical protein
MSATNTPTTLASRLKEVYPQGPTVLVPSTNELFGKRLEFRKDIEHGKKIVFDVQLSGEQGFTVGTGDVTLLGAVAQTSAPAEVTGVSVILQSNVSYDAISRAKTSKQAFVAFNNQKYIPSAESYRTRCELLAMGYGRQGLGILSADDDGAGGLTISAGSWCAALWLTMLGATIQAYTALTGGSQHDGDMVVSAVNVTTRTVTVTGTSTSLASGDILFLKGHRGIAPIGIMDIAKNTGVLHAISAATYALWAANAYDVGTSALTLGKISLASALSADKGCNEKLTCFVPNKAFQGMVNDQAALREYGANYNPAKAETGFESIVFNGATGKIEIVPYMFSKEGEFVMFPERYTYLLGSEEMTNQLAKDGDIMFDLESTSAKQIRWFGDWTVFCEKPGFITYGTRSDSLALHT